MDSWAPFLVTCLLGFAATAVVAGRFPASLGPLIFFGFALRVVGSTLRYEVIERVYSGVGDAKLYFIYGRLIASRIADLDFRFLTEGVGPSTRWWGTQFVQSVTGFVVFFVGDSLRTAFLVFSLLSFLGVLLFLKAFSRAGFTHNEHTYGTWLLLWPSLWFWPSSVGKEALMVLAFGIAVLGYVGVGGRPRWAVLLPGLALIALIRPHVAAVFGVSVAMAELLQRSGGGRGGRLLSGLVAVGLALVSVDIGLAHLGLDADLEGIEEELRFRAEQTQKGGSSIAQASGWLAAPLGLLTVLARPFPWESGGIALFSGLEMSLLWFLVFRRRRELSRALSAWRTNRFLVLLAPLTLAMALMYGLAFANLGIIARQRVVILPGLLCLLAVGLRHPVPRREQGARDQTQMPLPARTKVRVGSELSVQRSTFPPGHSGTRT